MSQKNGTAGGGLSPRACVHTHKPQSALRILLDFFAMSLSDDVLRISRFSECEHSLGTGCDLMVTAAAPLRRGLLRSLTANHLTCRRAQAALAAGEQSQPPPFDVMITSYVYFERDTADQR